MSYYNRKDTKELKGLVVNDIDVVFDKENIPIEILITIESGHQFLFGHDQDCCEKIYIFDFKGDLQTLKNKKLISVEKIVWGDKLPDDVNYKPYDSFTWTEIVFKTTEETVISRWIGESNGYYSESVDLFQLK